MSVYFSIDAYLAFPYAKRFHKCQVTMTMEHPMEDWSLTCPYYFVTYYGRLNNPCDIDSKNLKHARSNCY